MLSGRPPFHGTSGNEIMEQVLDGQYSFHAPCWADITSNARHLIQMLLCMNPTLRYTADRACDHEWTKIKIKTESLVKLEADDSAPTLLTSPRRSRNGKI